MSKIEFSKITDNSRHFIQITEYPDYVAVGVQSGPADPDSEHWPQYGSIRLTHEEWQQIRAAINPQCGELPEGDKCL